VATISLLSVGFQLMHFRDAQEAAGGRSSVPIQIRDVMSDSTVEIWPASSLIDWPPAEVLDEEGLDFYAHRWDPTEAE
jgi:hypothetical protein